MVWINTDVLENWQQPDGLRGVADDLRREADAFSSTVHEAYEGWSRFPGAYEGGAQEDLYSAMDLVILQTQFMTESSGRAAKEIEDLATRLEAVHRGRDYVKSKVDAFNAANAATPLGELDAFEGSLYHQLQADVEFAGWDYHRTVEKYAASLDSITTDFVAVSHSRGIARAGLDAGSVALSGLAVATTETRHLPSVKSGRKVPSSLSSQNELFGSPIKGFKADQKAKWANGWSQVRRNPLTLGHENASLLGKQFLHGLAGGIPGMGVTQALTGLSVDSRHTAKLPNGKAGVAESLTTRSHYGRALGKIGGAGGSVVFGILEYKDRDAENKAELAREHEDWSVEKVKSEAANDAAAETVGSVGSSVVAGVAVGAAVGSVVPIAGTAVGAVVGVVAGLAVGVAVEHKFMKDADGDGHLDSLTDRGAMVIKDIWRDIRSPFA